jgi:hypothetical protein
MRKKRVRKDEKREVTPEFVNMSKEILYPQIQGVTLPGAPNVGVSTPGGSLDRRVNCRRVPQPRWVGARRSAKGGDRRKKGKPTAFVFVPRPGRVRLQ